MRADRLSPLLMLLQTRGQMTAGRTGRELEVSERTIYRDMEALSMAGVPVVAERGPGGGCGLLPGWRSDLTGLTATEAAALAALDIPAPLAQLGIGASLRQALLKLLAATPAASQPTGGLASRVYVDPTPWAEAEQPAVPLLSTVYRAVMAGQRLRVARDGPRGEPLWLELDPHGLVSKEGRWYLLGALGAPGLAVGDAGAGAHAVVFRVDHLLAAEPLDAPVALPPGFDLKARWERAREALAAERQPYPVRLRVAPTLADELRRQFPGQGAAIDAALAAAGRRLAHRDAALWPPGRGARRILAWGGAAVVLAPRAAAPERGRLCATSRGAV